MTPDGPESTPSSIPDDAASRRHVFQSPSNKRWKRTRWAMIVAGFVVLSGLAVLAGTMLSTASLQKVKAARSLNSAEAATYVKRYQPVEKFRQSRAHLTSFLMRRSRDTSYHANDADDIRAGFFVNWDAMSFESMKAHIRNLNTVFLEWSRIIPGHPESLVFDPDSNAAKLLALHTEVNVHCMVSNYDENTQQWRGDILSAMLIPDKARKTLERSILKLAADNHFYGINIDFEDVPTEVQPYFLQFMRELHYEFARLGTALSIDLPVDDNDFDLHAYSDASDYIVLMAYDQHSAVSVPGPISSVDWFAEQIDRALKVIPKNKLIVGLAQYGYDWATDANGSTRMADEVSFEQAVVTARESDTTLTFDTASSAMHYTYDNEDSSHHDVWVNDAVTMYNLLSVLDNYDIAGTAIWRLGAEDPSIWGIYAPLIDRGRNSIVNRLRTIEPPHDPEYQGDGELINLVAEPKQGARTFVYDSTQGFISSEVLSDMPSSYILRRYGRNPHKIVLTFDDGPDPAWTPKVLDILGQKHAPAVFFVVGVNAESNLNLMKRIIDEGHEMGNHTFTHPNIATITPARTATELALTENIIRAISYTNSVLFRPPYVADAEPTTSEELEPVARAARLGYTMIGSSIDPQDWNTPRTSKQIVDSCLQQLSLGSIVLLHDAGGDRSATVEALPILIDTLRKLGYEISSLANFTGIPRASFMQPLTGSDLTRAETDRALLTGVFYIQLILYAIFFGAIILSIARMLLIALLAIAQFRRSRFRPRPVFEAENVPFISVIVPAYNENIVVVRTVQTVLASQYAHFEILIVDDGSTDDTFEIAGRAFRDNSCVQTFTKPNGGKASALNFGIQRAIGDIIVVIDADTQFDKEALGELAVPFMDEKVGAVAGNVKIGNVSNLLTRWQAIEYITSQNFDRRAFESLGAITVVPGAIGAFRKSALAQIGYYTSDTLAEDTDLTMRLLRNGWKIKYAEHAKAWTEAPERVKPFLKQRFRWTFGTIQAFYKNRSAMFNRKARGLGLVAMPNILLFQVLLPMLSPVVDLIFIVSLLTGHTDVTVISYLLFLAIDLVGSTIAFALEGERLGLLVWLPLQRFLYRQFMYYVLYKSILAALRGQLQSWGKLQRTGNVKTA